MRSLLSKPRYDIIAFGGCGSVPSLTAAATAFWMSSSLFFCARSLASKSRRGANAL
jgi:hypothetical protein